MVRYHSAVQAYLDTISVDLDLAPADCLIRSGTGITAVELLCCVDVNRTLGAIPHQARIGNVMFDQTTTKYDHACSFRVHGYVVESADVASDADVQYLRRPFEGVKVEHVAEATVRQSRTEDWYVVFVGPVTD